MKVYGFFLKVKEKKGVLIGWKYFLGFLGFLNVMGVKLVIGNEKWK